MYIVNEDSLNEELYIKVKKQLTESGRISLRRNIGYKIVVDEEMVYKQGNGGIMTRNFEIFVRVGEIQISKIEKSYDDFIAFQKNLDTELRPVNLRAPKLAERDYNVTTFQSDYDKFFRDSDHGLNTLSVEDQFRNIKAFCNTLSKNTEFFISSFYDFFSIPEKHQYETEEEQMSINNSTASVMRQSEIKATIRSVYENNKANLLNLKGENIKWKDFRKESTQKYSIYFQVYCEEVLKVNEDDKFYSFIFRIQSVLNSELNFSVVKRYSEFAILAGQLKKKLKIRPPPIPQKNFLAISEENLEKRRTGLTEWLMLVLNEKMFHSKLLFNFVHLGSESQNSHMAYTPISNLYENFDFDLRVIDTQTVTNADMDNTFTLYSISVSILEHNMKNLVSCYIVQRRYSEFSALHKILKKKFSRYKENLADVPGKLSFKLESRVFQFEDYLNKMIHYPDIFDSIDFRKFLTLNPMTFNQFTVQNQKIQTGRKR